jgi:transcriptional repressor NrdR
MKCPFCGNLDSKVIDSRLIEEGSSTRRRRKCDSCSARFTTYERYSVTPLMVVKKNNRREPFDRNKIWEGISTACNKRGISNDTIEKMVKEIEKEVREVPNSEVSAEYVGELVMEKLREVDEVAYMRFASVYKGFDDLGAFIKEANTLGKLENGIGKPVHGKNIIVNERLMESFNKV